MYHIVKYKDTRYWAVLHHNGKLLAVVVYKKGAEAIVQALEQILVLLPFTKKKRKIPGLNIHLADSMILAQLLQAIYNLIARR